MSHATSCEVFRCKGTSCVACRASHIALCDISLSDRIRLEFSPYRTMDNFPAMCNTTSREREALDVQQSIGDWPATPPYQQPLFCTVTLVHGTESDGTNDPTNTTIAAAGSTAVDD